jgi:hypothetical protein
VPAPNWRGAALDRALRTRDIRSSARKAKDGFKQAAPRNCRTRRFAQRSVRRLFILLAGRTNLTGVETFAGAACLTKFAAVHADETIIAALLGTIQSGSPPGALLTYTAPSGSWLLLLELLELLPNHSRFLKAEIAAPARQRQTNDHVVEQSNLQNPGRLH